MEPSVLGQIAQTMSLQKKGVVFTGAGMSTESGIPDFRSPDGVWTKVDLEKVATANSVFDNTKEFQDFFRQRIKDLRPIEPNVGHQLLASWGSKNPNRDSKFA